MHNKKNVLACFSCELATWPRFEEETVKNLVNGPLISNIDTQS